MAITAFREPTPAEAAKRLAVWGTPEAHKFYWVMRPKTAWVIAHAETAVNSSGYVAARSWGIAIANGIIPE